jgi:hypothetical protein
MPPAISPASEFVDGLRVDRRDRGGKADRFGGQRQPDALRHVGIGAGDLDLRETAALARLGDQVEGRLLSRHFLSPGFGLGDH